MKNQSPSTITVQYNGDRFGLAGPDHAEMSYEDLQSVREAHSIVGGFIETQNPNRLDTSIISKNHADIGRFLDQMWNTIPPLTHTSTCTAIKAEEVFNTPELLERILLQLTTADKLKAMQVKRQWFETVRGSVSLRRALGLEPYGDGHYNSPFSQRFRGVLKHEWGVSFPAGIYEDEDKEHLMWDEDRSTYYWNQWGDSRRLKIFVTISSNVDPSKFGRNIQRLGIFEPGVTQIRAASDCSPRCRRLDPEGNEYGHHPGYTFTNEDRDPFTVGRLLNGAAWIKFRHSTCQCDNVCFTAVLELEENDPIVLERRCIDERDARTRKAAFEASAARHEAIIESAENIAPNMVKDVGETATELQVEPAVGTSPP